MRNAIAQKLLNFVINRVATKEYSKMIHVMIGLGVEQLRARRPINYDQEFTRLKTMGVYSSNERIFK